MAEQIIKVGDLVQVRMDSQSCPRGKSGTVELPVPTAAADLKDGYIVVFPDGAKEFLDVTELQPKGDTQ